MGLSNKLLQCSKGGYLSEAANESPKIPGGQARRPVLTARLKGVVVALAYVLLDYRRPPLRRTKTVWQREKVGFIENTARRHRWGG